MTKKPHGTWPRRILTYLTRVERVTGTTLRDYMRAQYPGELGKNSAILRSAVANLTCQGFVRQEGRGLNYSFFSITDAGRARYATEAETELT